MKKSGLARKNKSLDFLVYEFRFINRINKKIFYLNCESDALNQVIKQKIDYDNQNMKKK